MHKFFSTTLAGIFLLAGAFTATSSCTTTPYKPNGNPDHGALKAPSGYKPGLAEQLTFVGENYQGQFSLKNDRILFLSHSRPLHKHSQTYELILSIKKETRVTYHDGENLFAIYGELPNQIIYASSTDEIKENLDFSLNNRGPQGASEKTSLPGTELYLSTVSGKTITRLTDSVGFDSQPSLAPTGKELIFSSSRNGKPQLFKYVFSSGKTQPFKTSEDWMVEPTYSPDGEHLAWVEWKPELEESQIVLAQKKDLKSQSLTTGAYMHRSPAWHPSGKSIIYSSNHEDGKNFELFFAATDGSCQQRLTYHLADDLFPAFSPDGKKVIFTSNRTGSLQLYAMDFAPPACAK